MVKFGAFDHFNKDYDELRGLGRELLDKKRDSGCWPCRGVFLYALDRMSHVLVNEKEVIESYSQAFRDSPQTQDAADTIDRLNSNHGIYMSISRKACQFAMECTGLSSDMCPKEEPLRAIVDEEIPKIRN